jgi:leader peptidase (prepilin peptidase)/N-methyltransferase
MELACGGIFVLVALWEPWAEALILGFCFALLLALSVIDFRYKAVPDALSFPALGLAFLSGDILLSLEHGLLFAGGFALLRMGVSTLSKKEAMGEADILIASIIGAVLGINLGLVAIYIAAVLALFAFYLFSKKDTALPFIPFLALGLFITYLLQTPLTRLIEVYYG